MCVLATPSLRTWNLRVRAGSVSMCCLYSSSVVAPMTCSCERARAGFSMLAKSRPPSTLPAPTATHNDMHEQGRRQQGPAPQADAVLNEPQEAADHGACCTPNQYLGFQGRGRGAPPTGWPHTTQERNT
jgi:hypothetical protein